MYSVDLQGVDPNPLQVLPSHHRLELVVALGLPVLDLAEIRQQLKVHILHWVVVRSSPPLQSWPLSEAYSLVWQ